MPALGAKSIKMRLTTQTTTTHHPLKHTIRGMNELAGKNNFCCVNGPPINIDLDHVILDELHLLLRIMDVIFQIRVSVLDMVSKYKCHEQWRGAAKPLFMALGIWKPSLKH